MIRIPHLDLPAGNSTTIHLYNRTPMLLGHAYNLTAAADVLTGADWTEIETDNNVMTKRVLIEEGGFGNRTGPRGTGGGSNPTGGEYTETITGRVMEGMTFSTFGGGGGAGMFSALEWIMKGACVGDAGALRVRWVPDGAEELREGEPEFVAAVSGNFTKKEQLTW